MKNTLTAWSYSRLSVYRKCPRQFRYKFIEKLPCPDNYSSSRGSMIHAKAEQFVNGKIKGMPNELKQFNHEFREIKRLQASTELDLSVTKAWQSSFSMDWNNVWCRAFIDSGVVDEAEREATIIDYKTGKVYEKDHEEQGKLYATCAFAHFPDIQVVDVEMWYLDQGEVLSWNYDVTQKKTLQAYWNKIVQPMFRDKKFVANPGSHCRWCDFKDNCDEEGV